MKWWKVLQDAKSAGKELADLRTVIPVLKALRKVLEDSPEWGKVCKEWEEFELAVRRLAGDF